MEHSTAPSPPLAGAAAQPSGARRQGPDDVPALASAIRQGDARAIATAIVLLESGSSVSADLLRRLFPHTSRARVVGITGPPGAGKSSLIAPLTQRLTANGHRVAVLLVDPSSSITGGALLGDRVRMSHVLAGSRVFCRSMASRGALGGLAPATIGATQILDAGGYDVVVIETCGVGQNEIDVNEVADVVALVLQPGAGDDIQAVKAGIMEIADILVVNKSDQPSADGTIRQIRRVERGQQRKREVIATSAKNGEGIDELASSVERAIVERDRSGEMLRRQRRRIEHMVLDIATTRISRRLGELISDTDEGSALIDAVVGRESDPYSAASLLVSRLGPDPAQNET
jgi:LAO/AO transport system kinase